MYYAWYCVIWWCLLCKPHSTARAMTLYVPWYVSITLGFVGVRAVEVLVVLVTYIKFYDFMTSSESSGLFIWPRISSHAKKCTSLFSQQSFMLCAHFFVVSSILCLFLFVCCHSHSYRLPMNLWTNDKHQIVCIMCGQNEYARTQASHNLLAAKLSANLLHCEQWTHTIHASTRMR